VGADGRASYRHIDALGREEMEDRLAAEWLEEGWLRLYPKTARLSKIWAQASCTRASQFPAFFDQRVRRLRRLTSHEIVRSTIHRLAG
jgi:hypothetical protein